MGDREGDVPGGRGAAVLPGVGGMCSVRAFFVNAVQWAVYKWIMREFGQGRKTREEGGKAVGGMPT